MYFVLFNGACLRRCAFKRFRSVLYLFMTSTPSGYSFPGRSVPAQPRNLKGGCSSAKSCAKDKLYRYGSRFVDSESVWVRKELVLSLPEGYLQTWLGNPRFSYRQYRHPSGAHIREYPHAYEIHVDKKDPRIDPAGHLFIDFLPSLVFWILFLEGLGSLSKLLTALFAPRGILKRSTRARS